MTLFSKLSAGAAFAAFAAITPAAAQPAADPEPGVGTRITVVGAMAQPGADQDIDQTQPVTGTRITVVGAMRDDAQTPAQPEDESVPELPVVYEDDAG